MCSISFLWEFFKNFLFTILTFHNTLFVLGFQKTFLLDALKRGKAYELMKAYKQ